MSKPFSLQRAQGSLLVTLCVLFSIGASALPAWAQDPLAVTVRRDWGYGNGSQIQGHFSMEAVGPANLTAVVFKIDEGIVAEVTRPPFKIQFVTDDYPPGWHNLIVVGKTSDARTLTSAPRRFEFVSGAEAWAGAQRIIVSVLGAVMVVMSIVLTLQFVATRTGSKSAYHWERRADTKSRAGRFAPSVRDRSLFTGGVSTSAFKSLIDVNIADIGVLSDV